MNCLWRPCLLMHRDKISNHYRGPFIDALYQVSVHLIEQLQRGRLKCEKLMDDGRQTTNAKWWQKLTLPLARWAKNTMINRITMETVACLRSKCHLKQNLIPSWPWSFRHTSCISDFRCKANTQTRNFVGHSDRHTWQ